MLMSVVISAVLLTGAATQAAGRGCDWSNVIYFSLPDWAYHTYEKHGYCATLEPANQVNPVYQRGDFDGDGKPDIALFVRQRATSKVGILFIHATGKTHLIGAGNSIPGLEGDDFA